MKASRELLEERLKETQEELAQLDRHLQAKGDYGLGKGDPLIVRWELNLALREKLERKREQLEDALQRLDDGDYGLCASCGQRIRLERLGVLPGTALCIRCARQSEQGGKVFRSAPAQSGR